MADLYWLTRFQGIYTFSIIVAILSGAALVFSFIINLYTAYNDSEDVMHNKSKRCLKVFVPIFIISLLLSIFVPTTKQALIIYGVGGTIDYIKSNGKAKQLPDKAIDALDMYLESLKEEVKVEKKSKEE